MHELKKIHEEGSEIIFECSCGAIFCPGFYNPANRQFLEHKIEANRREYAEEKYGEIFRRSVSWGKLMMAKEIDECHVVIILKKFFGMDHEFLMYLGKKSSTGEIHWTQKGPYFRTYCYLWDIEYDQKERTVKYCFTEIRLD